MKKFLVFLLVVALIAISILLIMQAVWYGNLDHALQLEQNGFVKDDVTMLTYGQSVARVFCWLFGVISGIGVLALGLAAIDSIRE